MVVMICGHCKNTGYHEMWSYPEGAKGPHKKSIIECMSSGTMEELEESLEFFLHQMIRCKSDRKFDPENPLLNTCIGCQADRDPIRNIIAHMIEQTREEVAEAASAELLKSIGWES